ncbi:hypothetical protein [Clostridium tagluense]|uniref:Uncharacterized protein n=1 Tax=Clostridium tagluense TaxID=360422 RepID=A0A401UT16_9CLOT|nr:hypothetical protein [Clostridium tagluense]GCD12598.1 hypothetical protein Ctaglu_42210 [Clostridium tagluense]
MEIEKLGNCATLGLSNSHALKICVSEDGDSVSYQYSHDKEVLEAEIEYLEDTDNITGYADSEDGLFQPSFTTNTGVIYFIGQFMRDNY